MRKKNLLLLALWLITATFNQLTAQKIESTDAAISKMENAIPVDDNIRVGKLDNGLTYYIRKNQKPENKAELRLAVKAGSILEDEDQQGLAHFTEHMAFNGTKNFEKNELVNYLQSIGVKFGAHLNAYTSFDETVYMLNLPTDDQEVMDKGLQILEDWAHNVSFDHEEIDKERGVVLEEWRLGQGASQRMMTRYLPVLLKDSRYAMRLPIGEKEILENFKYETIKRFYNDWYRPDLMAVIAVGDFDIDAMEKQVKQQVGKIPEKKNPRKRVRYDIPDHPETLVSIATDKEASMTNVQVYYKHPAETYETVEDFRKQVVYALYNGMLNQRLGELRQKANPPFIFGNTYYGNFIGTKNAYTASAIVPETGVTNGLEALLEESKRVLMHGFTQGELERYKSELLASYESAYKERDKTESRSYASEYIRNFLENEPIPGIEYEYEFYKTYVPTVTLEEVNKLAEKWITKTNRVVVITGPEKEGVEMPTKEDVKAILDRVANKKVEAYEDNLTASALMDEMPEAGKVVKSEEKAHGVTEVTLSNGIKVVMKPTDFKNDEVLLDGFSLGGSSLYPEEDYYSATFADAVIAQGGIKDFSAIDLQKLMSGKIAGASPYIRQLSEGISGSAAPKDLESMFQMVHLYFTAPRKDKEAFTSFINRQKGLYKNLLSNPSYYFADQTSRFMTQNHPRGGGFPSEEDWDKIDLDRAFEIYQERFKNDGDLTFVMVGNFDVESVKPMLATYLGSIPQVNREEEWKDIGIRPPKGNVEKIVKKGSDQKSTVNLAITGEFDYDREEVYKMTSIAQALSIKLIEVLREEKGGVYGVGASASASEWPYGNYRFDIRFPCGPDNVDDLTEAALAELAKIRENGPTPEDLNKVKEAQKLEMKENLKQNRYWLSRLRDSYMYDRSFDDMMEYEARIDALTAEDLKETAQKYLKLENFAKMVLLPEETE